MSDPVQTPRQILRAAVKAGGGTNAIAAAIGSRASHVSNLICGHRPVGRETAARLRRVLPDVPAEVWVALLCDVRGGDAAGADLDREAAS